MSCCSHLRAPGFHIVANADRLGDPQIPHAHLHVHAMLGPIDTSLPGAGMWRRNVIFGTLNWWEIEDLRAEIRYVYSSKPPCNHS
jgi:diadenosine tetraphosphate (Ap4A) HIT family hydrolase